MMIARWQIQAKFGHKEAALDSMKRWIEEIGSQVGWTSDRVRVITGSVGAYESTIETEIKIKDLKELDDAWSKLAKLSPHKKWGQEFENLIVSGTARWEIYRVIAD